MSKPVVITIILVVIACAGVQCLTSFKAKSDLGDQIERSLDQVTESANQDVVQDLVEQAKKVGIKLAADDVQIQYKDTDIESYAQRLVGGKIGAQFKNKLVIITVQYTARVVFIPFQQEISRQKVRQVEAPRIPVNKATQELLDAN